MYIQGGEPRLVRAAGWPGYELRPAEQKNSLFWPLWLTLLLLCTTAAAESHFAASLDMVALVSYNGYSGPLPFLAFFCSTAIKAADDIQPIKASSFLCYSTTRREDRRSKEVWRGAAPPPTREVRYSQRRRKKPFRRVSRGDAGAAAASPIYFSIAILAFSSFFLHLLLPSFQDVLWNFANHKSRKLLLETDCRIRPFSLLCFGRNSSRSRRLRCYYARHRRASAMPLEKKRIRNKEQKRMVKQSCKEKCERKRRRRDSILIMRKFPRDPCTTIEDEEEYHIEEAAAAELL